MFSMQRQVYLDNNATTPVSRTVWKKMTKILKNHYGNPSSPYCLGQGSARILEESREIIASTIGADPQEVIFTSCATEANNQILKSLSQHYVAEGKKKIISSPVEHPSVMETLQYLENNGTEICYLSVDKNGFISLQELESIIDSNTFLICCICANNEIGTIQDIKAIGKLGKKYNIHVMSDCVQAIGKIPVDVKELGLDFASFSAHKIHGPKGIGAFYMKSDVALSPLIHGGHQEVGVRAGTESLHNIAGFAQACKAIPELLEKQAEIKQSKQTLIDGLKNLNTSLEINSPDKACLSNTISIRFPNFNNAVLVATLDSYGISVSAGSACSTGGTEPSHVLRAIGLSDNEANETLRISLSETTRPKDLSYVLRIFDNIFAGKTPEIQAIKASQVDKVFIDNPDNYLLDIRFWHERQMLKGLPNSREASFIFFKRYAKQIPKDKNIVVICMGGIDATAIAFSLKKRGIQNVSFILGGVIAWRIAQADLYNELGGTNITRLAPV